jgi:hypothetical protein
MAAQNGNVTEENAAEDVKAPMFLKVLVVVLGLAIVGMLTLMVVKLMAGDHKKAAPKEQLEAVQQLDTVEREISVALERGGVSSASWMETVTVHRPEGAEVVSFQLQGALLVVHLKAAEGADIFMSIDRETGKVTSVSIPK